MADKDHILITGASGFLGTWLADAAHEAGYGLLGLDIVQPRRPEIWSNFTVHSCDVADFETLVGSRKLRAVFHLAGSASVPHSVENPFGDFISLMPGTVATLVYTARHQRDAHFVLFSSAAVYGNPVRLPIMEDDLIRPISPYGIHKATAEFLVEQYARSFNFRASILRIFSAYGEGLRKQVVWDTCQKFLQAMHNGDPAIPMHGTGKETRDFIHAADVARAALTVADHPPSSGVQIINVATGEETPIHALTSSISRALSVDIRIAFNNITRAGDPVNWRADTSRLAGLGFRPMLSIDEGIRRTVVWQKNTRSKRSLG